jgi:arylsulfatase A-like enzyme
MAGFEYWNTARKTVDEHAAMMLNLIDGYAAAPGDPFMIFWHPYAPHNKAQPGRYKNQPVYIPPDPPNWNEADVSDKPTFIRGLPLLAPDAWREERANCQREIMLIDDAIQVILDRLNGRGLLDNTVVIFYGDNGFSWGAHRYIYKNLPYEECSRVPLFIRWPGLGGNRTEARLVSNVDFAPTIAALGGATVGRVVDGRDLTGLITNPAADWDEAVLLERNKGGTAVQHYAVRIRDDSGDWMYSEYTNGDRELYDMAGDPFQLVNVAGRPEYAAVVDALHGKIQEMK